MEGIAGALKLVYGANSIYIIPTFWRVEGIRGACTRAVRPRAGEWVQASERQHKSSYVSNRQHTSAYVSIRHTHNTWRTGGG